MAGHSSGLAWHDANGTHLRKTLGKVINFLAEYPDIPNTNLVLGHSRYASVGVINVQNAHPIKLYFRGKKIGYAVHNGTWTAYKKYEQYRLENQENKTDSALMFAIYGKMLEKYGDSPNSRRRALATLQKIVEPTNGYQNLILMFDDGQVIFSAKDLTLFTNGNTLQLMTFGFNDNPIDSSKIYEIKGFDFEKFEFMPYNDFILEEKKEFREVLQIDNKKWKLVKTFDDRNIATLYSLKMKKLYNTNYRTIPHTDGKVGVYVRRKDK